MKRLLFLLIVIFPLSSQAQTTTTLVPLQSIWKYLDNGTNQGTAWRALTFNDTTWAQGPGQLGYGDGDEATVVSYGPNASAKYITTYFRRSFSVGGAASFTSANLRIRRDDGVVVYLNGTEVYRTNLPGGTITSTTLATAAIGGADESALLTATASPALLVEGNNVLAVEMHQNAGSSTDLTFDMELTATAPLTGVPAAFAQSIALIEDTSAAVTLTGSDPEGSPLVYSIVSGPAAGVLTGTPPVLTYTPPANFAGATSFSFKVNDGTYDSPPATVSLTISPVNDPPEAFAQFVSTMKGTPVTLTLTGSDVESRYGTLPDYAQQLFLADLTAITDGLSGATWNADTGTLFFIRNVSSGAGHSYEYTADGVRLRTITQSGFQDTEAIAWMYGNTYAIAEENNFQRITICTIPPGATTLNRTAAGHVTWNTVVGSLLNLGVESLCYDRGRDLLYYVAEKPAGGTWNIYTMDPSTGASGVLCNLNATVFNAGVATDLSDIAFDRATDTLVCLSHESNKVIRVSRTGTVLEQKAIPGFTQAEALALTPDRLRLFIGGEPKQFARYSLPPDTLTYSLVSGPSSGSLSGLPPLLTYTPSAGFSGTDSFTFNVSDGSLTTAPVTVTISVIPPNAPPTAGDGTVAVNEDASTPVVLDASDPDSDPLVYFLTSLPVHGILTGTAPNLLYTPAANYHGPDSFAFHVNDGVWNSLTATVTVNITPVPDVPVAHAGSGSIEAGYPLPLDLTGSDADGDALSYAIGIPPAHGILTGTPPYVTYTPNVQFAGVDVFTFTVHDGTLTSSAAEVTINVSPSNLPPVVQNSSIATAEDTPAAMTLSASDPEGLPLSFVITAPPQKGLLSGTPPTLIYTPYPNVSGDDAFAWTASDGRAVSAAVLTITVVPVNDTPVAADAAITGVEDTAAALALTASDIDGDTLTFALTSLPAHGTLAGTAPDLVYTPDENWHGADSFTFHATDGTATSAPAVVSITVAPVNDAPGAAAQAVATEEDTALAVVLNGTDADGDAVNFTITSLPVHGTLGGTPPNLTYTPDPDWHGADSFLFAASDGAANSGDAAVNITVAPVNDSPSAVSAAFTASEEPVAILLSATDADGDILTFAVTVSPAHGNLTGVPPNLQYIPNQNWQGSDSFSFTVSDGFATSAPAVVTIETVPINRAPAGISQSLATVEDLALGVTLTGTDPDGDPLSFAVAAPPAHGTLSGAAPDLIYTPDQDWNGTDSFSFIVSDTAVVSAPAMVTLEVAAANDAPVATPQAIQQAEDTSADVLLGGTDADGDSVTFVITVPPAHGTLTGAPPQVTYTPDKDWNGADSIAFTAGDGSAVSAPAVVSLTVIPVNDAPVVAAAEFSTEVGVPVSVTLPGSDAEGDSLTWEISVSPAFGTLSGSGAARLYTPNLAWSGTDQFWFTVSDGSSTSPAAYANVTVTSSGPWQLITRTGLAAPGAGGATFSILATDFVSDASGRATFRGTAGSITGIWTEGAAGLEAVAAQGGAASDVTGAIFDAFTTGPWAAGDGEVLIFGKLLAGPGGVSSSSDLGYWLRNGGSLSLVARENDPAPGLPAAARFNVLSSVATLESSGNYAFAASLRTSSALGITTANDTGLWATFGAPARLLVRENGAAPGTSGGLFDTLTSASLVSNGAGQIGFATSLKTGGAVSTTNRYGVWLWDPGQFGLVARGGNAAPGIPAGGVFALPQLPALGESLAFYSTLATGIGGVANSSDTGIWSLEGGSIALQAREGFQAPGIPAGGLFNNLTEGATVNAAGEFAFRASLRNGGGVSSSNNAGLWSRSRFTGNILTIIARKGSIAPGAGAATFASFDVPFLAGDGGEVFTASLTSGGGVSGSNDRGLWLRTSTGSLTLALREGATFTPGPGESRTISAITLPAAPGAGRNPLSDEGRLLVHLAFTDGSSALYHYVLP